MIGDGVMSCPILEKGMSRRDCYFPEKET